MTIDENRPAWEHARLRQNYAENDYGPDDGSVEAEEAMQAEGAARRRSARLALAGHREHRTEHRLEPDRRLHGWREEQRFEDAIGPEDAA